MSAEPYLEICEAWLNLALVQLELLRSKNYTGNVPSVRQALGKADAALQAFDDEWKRELQESSP